MERIRNSNLITFTTRQGPRDYQGDYHVIQRVEGTDFYGWLLAIFDGHVDKTVAEFCAREAGKIYNLTNPDYAEESLSNLIKELATYTEEFEAGSTASVVLVLESHDKVSAAVLGDSPVVVLDKNGQFHVSPSHNVRTNFEERSAAEKLGGVYLDGYIYIKDGDHGLQLSRVLGDVNLGEIISRVPEVYSVNEPQWILLASDGVFDSTHENTDYLFGEIKEMAKNKFTAEKIIEWAEDRGLDDNATAIVWSKSLI